MMVQMMDRAVQEQLLASWAMPASWTKACILIPYQEVCCST